MVFRNPFSSLDAEQARIRSIEIEGISVAAFLVRSESHLLLDRLPVIAGQR